MSVYGPWAADAMTAWLSGKTIKAMLVDSAYVPSPGATTAPTGSEVSGTGYTAGGVDITSLVAFTYDSASDQVRMTCSGSISFGTLTVTGIGGIVYYVSGGKPIAVDMFGATDVAGAAYTYPPDAAGLVALQVGG